MPRSILPEKNTTIRLLSQDVANKIAAGEVVERPASVVKELLENSFDAGATRIDVSVSAGGRKLISIADNGSGMSRDDALMAPERQATSKIRTAEDIERITTMGFRGEALASIASVSRFSLKTRRARDEAGTEVLIHGGTMVDVRDCGLPPGTAIEVRDLFYNLPARRSFLRSYATEEAHIRTQFVVHAIARPDVAMSLLSDGNPIHRLRPAASLRERLCDLFSAAHMDHFVPVDYHADPFHVTGFAGIPGVARPDAQAQYIFVNGRPATAPAVQAALREAYPHLPPGRRPAVFLFLEVPPDGVDVNVHPTKREVRFRAIGAVRDAILKALADALHSNEDLHPSDALHPGDALHPSDALHPAQPIPTLPGKAVPPPAFPQTADSTDAAPTPPPVDPVFAPPPIQQEFHFAPVSQNTFRPVPAEVQPFRPVPADGTAASPAVPESGTASQMPVQKIPETPHKEASPYHGRLLGILQSGYALLETSGGYMVLDPSAAHERILYEKLLAQTTRGKPLRQSLLIPQSLTLSPLDARRIRSLLPILESMGFEIEAFGRDTFVVHAMPQDLAAAPAKAILEETALALEEAGPRKGRLHWQEELVAASASRSAVRNSAAMTGQTVLQLLSELQTCRLPYATPDGRPTMIFTSDRELNRKFGRK